MLDIQVGAGSGGLVIPTSVSRLVSRRHARLVRHGAGIDVIDSDSKNGISLELGGPHVKDLRVQPGESFCLADVQLLALNPTLEHLRGRLAWYLGLDQHHQVDRAVAIASRSGPVALLGPPGAGAAAVAAALHAASSRRHNAFVALDPMSGRNVDLRGATAFVPLTRRRAGTAALAARLLDSAGLCRPIFAARTEADLATHLGPHLHQAALVHLVPLEMRRGEVPALLDAHWRDVLKTPREVAELGAAIASLTSYGWPKGIEELHEQSPRLLAYLQHGTLRAAAAALGIAHQTLDTHLHRLGLDLRTLGRRR